MSFGRRVVAVAAACMLTAGVLAGSPAEARPRPGAPGIGDPYFPFDGNGGIDVTHYAVHDRYDLASGRLSGRTRLDVIATRDLSSFDLDFLLPVSQVTVDGRRAVFRRSGNHELVITPRRPLEPGTAFRVRVAYAGRPAEYRSRGRHWLADRHEVAAMNEPHMATWWFPANDHPLDKASYDLFITARKALTVVANGERVERRAARHGGGGWATTHWRETDPMASYLAFFAAGDFAVRHGVDTSPTTGQRRPWYVAVSRRLPGRAQRGDLRAVLRSREIVDWLEEQLGPYPFTSTGGVVTSLDPGFALENQTRPTYPAFEPTNITLVVHELTHQWFGDSVSVHHWRDIWLNEGFAQWFQLRWNETHEGLDPRTWLDGKYEQYAGRRPFWRLRIDDPGPRRLFDVAVYDRGAMAVQALRQRIGDDAFFALLRTWVAQRQGRTGRVGQFEALAEQVSGQDLGGFFDAWLRAPRPPARTAANGLR